MIKEHLIDLEPDQLGLLEQILKRHIPNKTVWAYGSRVTWKADERSDLDLVVFDCNSMETGALREALEESNLLVSVDVMKWESIPENFKKNIREKYVVLQEKMKLDGWREVKLGEVVTFQRGFDLPKIKRTPGKYPLMVSNGQDSTHDDYKVKAPGVVTGRSGTLGEVFFVKENFWPLNTTLWVKDFHENDCNFIYYFLKTLSLGRYNAGSGVPTLNRNHINSLSVCIPPLPEQKAIAEVLSSLDDKIDLLHRQNKTLEDMAQTLFRKWFIAEANEEWKEKPLDEIANYLNGLACQKYPPNNLTDKLPVLKIKQLRSGIDENSDWVTSEVENKYIVKRGDVIFSWSGSLMIKLWDGVKCVLNQHLFKVSSEQYPKWYIYLWTKHHIDKFIKIAESKATTMGHIKRSDLSSSLVLVPSSQELSAMSGIISPLLEEMILNFKQIHTLSNLRDVLLPKLMSGKARVRF